MKLINSVYGSAQGGRWQVFCDYSLLLRELGHDVLTVVNTRINEDPTRLFANEAPIVRLRNSGHYDPFATLVAWNLIRREKPKAIITHSGRATHLFKHASFNRVPVIAVNHSTNIKRSLIADAFLAISNEIKESLESQFAKPKPCYILPNPVTLNGLKSFEWRPFRPVPVIGFLSRLVVDKGIYTFLEALKQLQSKPINFQAVIGGDGEEMETVKKVIHESGLNDRVKLQGWNNNREAFYRGLDLFVFPSEREAAPLAPIEAALMGVTVVASDLPGIAEFMDGEHKSHLVPPSNPVLLSEAIQSVLQNPLDCEKRAKALWEKAHQLHTPQNLKSRLNHLIGEIVEAFPNGWK